MDEHRFFDGFNDEYLKKLIDSANVAKDKAQYYELSDNKSFILIASTYYELFHLYNELAYQYEVALNRRTANSDKKFIFIDHYIKLVAKHALLLTHHIAILASGKGDLNDETGKTYNNVRVEALKKRIAAMK